jgi:tetratricopeptide (TPR) repeat protein
MFSEALASFAEAMKINEYDPDAYYYRGECRERMGKWIEAKLDKLKAHQLGFRG